MKNKVSKFIINVLLGLSIAIAMFFTLYGVFIEKEFLSSSIFSLSFLILVKVAVNW